MAISGRKIKIGLIGCGGRMEAHMAAIEKMEDACVVAVADPVQERREAAAKRFGCTRIYKNHTELYDGESKDTIDALFISIEPNAHTDTETRAIDMGIPFMIEKPMTIDEKQAEDVAKRIEKAGLITAVGFQDRYLDLFDMMLAELPKHKNGGLVYGAWVGGIPGVWWWQKKSTCAGQLVEQNIHLLDGLRFLFGEPVSVYATASTGMVKAGVDASAEYDTDDHSTAVIRFANNVTATLVSGCYCKGISPRCGLVITLEDLIMDYQLRRSLTFKRKTETLEIQTAVDQTYRMDRTFIDAVKSGDASAIRSPYSDALKSLKLGFAANKSMETGQVIAL